MFTGYFITPPHHSKSTFFGYQNGDIDSSHPAQQLKLSFSTENTALGNSIRSVLNQFSNLSTYPSFDLGYYNHNNNHKSNSLITGDFHIHIGTKRIISHSNLDLEQKVINIDNKLHQLTLEKMLTIGHQRHLKTEIPQLTNDDYYNISKGMSLGSLRRSTQMAEPIIRDASHCQVFTRAIRKSVVLDEINALPTGLYPEEACQLMRYVGEASNLETLHIIHESSGEKTDQAAVIALMVWYAIEGYSFRSKQLPKTHPELFDNYLVENPNSDLNLSFYKHKTSERWWAQVTGNEKYIPCSYEEYNASIKGDLSTNLLLLL